MPQKSNQAYIRTIQTDIVGISIADDEYLFDLDPFAPLNNILEFFYFTDAGGAQVDATAGTIVVTLSPGANIFQTINDGSFNAVDARLETRTKPSGFGKAEKVKITLAGVSGGGATGFAGLVSQSIS